MDLLDVSSLLTEDEVLVRDTVARFVSDNVLPVIRECFEEHRFPKELIPGMANLGLFGSTLHGYGCAGLNNICNGLICRELERGDSGLRSFISVQSSFTMFPIHRYGSDLQKERWLPAMAHGEALGCFGLTEAHGGSDPGNMKTRAKRDGDDWILNGSKMWITNGTIADVALVWAMTDEGIRGFLVEPGMRGFEATDIERKFSMRASVTSALFLDNVRVPAENVLPDAVGLRYPLSCLTQARYGICWGAIGAAQACFEEVLAHAHDRILFDRPLSHTQSIQIRLAEMARRITTAQLLAFRLGKLKDAGQLQPAQVSLAKWHNVRAALQIARDSRDMLGGSGITVEHTAMRHMLNLETVNTYEGTETVHQLIVGQALTGVNAF